MLKKGNPPVPHSEKVKPAFSQVGVLSVGVNLSVAHNLFKTRVETDLVYPPERKLPYN